MPSAQDDDLVNLGTMDIAHQVRRSAKWNDEIARARAPNGPSPIRKLEERPHRGIEDTDGPLRNHLIFAGKEGAQSDKISDRRT
jgi:hypothetical protein